MDFSLSDDQVALASLAAEIINDHVTHEHLKELEAKSWSLFDSDLWAKLAEAGITGIAIPESAGGAGLGILELGLIADHVGQAVAPVPVAWTLVTAYVLSANSSSADAVASYLPGVVAGTTLLTAGLEPGVGVRARRDGSGYVLDGEVGFVPYGTLADAIVVPATAEDGTTVAAIVPRTATGVGVTELETTNREPLALLSFDGVSVAASAVVEDASELLADLRRHITAVLCCVASGVVESALKRTAKHTSTREQFGKPIASFQAVGQRAADAYIDATMMKLTATQAVWRLSAGWSADEEVASAKFWAGDGGMRALHACQHLHGGLGVDMDYPLHRYFLWGKQLEHQLGTPTQQLLSLGAHLAATPV